MAQPIGSAYAEIKLNRRGFNSQLGAMGTSFNRTGGKMQGMAKQISGSFLGMATAAGVVIAAIKGVNAAVNKFVEFDTKLRNVWTLTDMTWEQMKGLGKEVQTLAAEYGKLGTEGLDAMYQIYSAGFQGADGMELFEQALIGALAGMTTVKQQADVLAGTLNAYGWSVEKASYVNDVFFKVIEKGVTNASELGASFGKLTAIAAPLGVEFEELAGAIITLTKSGIGTAETMTSMRQSIIELSKPGESLIAVMKALGYETGQAMIANIGWAGSIAEITKYAIANNLELIDLFSSVEAIMAILPLATTQAEMFAQSQDEVADATGAAEAAAEKQRGEQLKLDVATSNLEVAMVGLGESIGTVVDWKVGMKNFLASMIDGFTLLAGDISDAWGWLVALDDAMQAFEQRTGIDAILDKTWKIAKGVALLASGQWMEGINTIAGEAPTITMPIGPTGQPGTGQFQPLPSAAGPRPAFEGDLLDQEFFKERKRLSNELSGMISDAFSDPAVFDFSGAGMPSQTTTQYGPRIGTEPDVPEAVIGPWTDAFDELADALSADPTGGVDAIRSFLTSYGEVPAALLAGGSAASAVLRDLEQLQTLGMGTFTDDIQWLEDFLGISAEQAKKQADEAISDAKDLATKEAKEAKDIFDSKFIDPIAKALRTGDWVGAAETISVMAGNLPALIAEAKAMALKHDLDIDNLYVLNKLVRMEGDLVAALEARIEAARQAGDFDLVAELRRQLEIISPANIPDTDMMPWIEKYGAMVDTVLEFIPAIFTNIVDALTAVADSATASASAAAAEVAFAASAFVDVASMAKAASATAASAEEKTKAAGEAVSASLQLVAAAIQGWISILEEKKSKLEEQLDFYTSAYEAMGSVFGGGLLGGVIDLFVSSIGMVVDGLEGMDLLRVGLSSLVTFVNVLISSFKNLISASDAGAMMQKASQVIWTEIGNLLGEFLWPVAAALRIVKQWLGITSVEVGGSATAGQVGVPSGYKTERLRYQAIAPGDRVFDSEEEEVQIPAWAEPVGNAIANSIKLVLASFGISNWTELLEGAKRVSQNVWAWISTRLPAIVMAIVNGIARVKGVLAEAGVTWDSIVNWLSTGVDYIIEHFHEFAGNAAKFFVNLSTAAIAIVSLLGSLPTWTELNGKWTDFTTALEGLDALPDIVTAIEGVDRQIEILKRVLAVIIGAAAGAIVGSLVAAFPWALIGMAIGGLLGGLGGDVLADVSGRAYHSGGIVQGPPGIEQTIKAMPGETILPTHKSGGGGFMRPIVIPIMLDGRKVGEGMVKWATNEGWELTGHSGGNSAWTGRGT